MRNFRIERGGFVKVRKVVDEVTLARRTVLFRRGSPTTIVPSWDATGDSDGMVVYRMFRGEETAVSAADWLAVRNSLVACLGRCLDSLVVSARPKRQISADEAIRNLFEREAQTEQEYSARHPRTSMTRTLLQNSGQNPAATRTDSGQKKVQKWRSLVSMEPFCSRLKLSTSSSLPVSRQLQQRACSSPLAKIARAASPYWRHPHPTSAASCSPSRSFSCPDIACSRVDACRMSHRGLDR